jgi:non-canonical purine NTP pyrophosphatase (RdgB/HAM1 family)
MKKLFFATGNKNKLKEAREILGIEIEQIDIDLDEIQSIDVVKVVKHKVMQAYLETGSYVLVEDTGLYFNVWNGLPGALIKFFIDPAGNEKLLKMLELFEDRNAVAVTAAGFYNGKEVIFAEGEIKGSISTTCRGNNGFGWDNIFIPAGYDKTFAEMTGSEKNSVSMRKIAFNKFKKLIEKEV